MTLTIKPPLNSDLLYWIQSPGITAFRLRFRNIHAFSYTKSRFLDMPDHPLAPVVLSRYAQREEVPLWWGCIAAREPGHSDRVVRSWLARRTRNAFEESLRKKGFDTNGRPLPESQNKADLFGTAFLSVSRQTTKMSFVDLVQQTDVAVTYIQRFQAKGRNRPTPGKPRISTQRTEQKDRQSWRKTQSTDKF